MACTSKKLFGSRERYDNLVNECNEQNVNEIINMSLLSQILETSVLCKECFQMSMRVSVKRHIGLAADISLSCQNCTCNVSFWSTESGKLGEIERNNCYDINVRLVYGLRSIGKGLAAGKMFCGVMNLPPPPSKFEKYNYNFGSCVEDVAMESMNEAIEEAVEENIGNPDVESPRDLTSGIFQTKNF